MQDSEHWWGWIEPAEDALATQVGRGPGDDDDDDDESGGGTGGNIDPDDDEGYDDDEDDDDDEEAPLQCVLRVTARAPSLRRSNPWYDARVRRSASF